MLMVSSKTSMLAGVAEGGGKFAVDVTVADIDVLDQNPVDHL